MPILSASAVQYPERGPTLWSAPPSDPQHIIRLSIGAFQQTWLGDDDVELSQLPQGASWIDAPLAEQGIPRSISMTPGISTGESNISGATYRFLDDLDELSEWYHDKVGQGLQLFGGTLEHFIVERGESIADDEDLQRALWYTWQVKGAISLDRRVYEISCEDVNRDIEREIFTERNHILMFPIAEDSTDIVVYIPDEQAEDLDAASWVWRHGDDYVVNAGELSAIGLLSTGSENEYISWNGVEPTGQENLTPDGFFAKLYRLTGVKRGLLGTTPKAWELDDTVALNSRQSIVGVPYMEEHPLSALRAAYAGETIDGRAFPWGLDVPTRWIDDQALSSAIMDTPNLRITVQSPEAVKAKEFAEKHCLARRGIMIVNPYGALSYVPTPIGTGVSVVTLNEDNCYGADIGKLVHDDKDTAISTIIKWHFDPLAEDYRKTTEFVEPLALGEISATESITVEAPYLTTNRSTEGEVLSQARVLHALHARPVKRITLKPEWSFAHYGPGTVAQVNLPRRDYSNGRPILGDISMTMMVASITRDHHSEELTWNMIGFRPLPSALTNVATARPPDEEYIANGIELQVNNNIASLSQQIDLTQKYYTLDDVTLPEGWPGSMTGRGGIELWCKGVLLNASQIVLDGLGGRGGDGNNEAALAGIGVFGERGLIPAPSPSGSILVRLVGEGSTNLSVAASSRPPLNASTAQTYTPTIPTVENGRLVGLPATLMGSGGTGGDDSRLIGPFAASGLEEAQGSRGGDGSGYFLAVCDAGSGFIGSGSISINGLDGEAPTVAQNIHGGSGAGGARGQISIYHTSQGTPWSFDGARVSAVNGQAILSGDRMDPVVVRFDDIRRPTRSFYDPAQDATNQWADAVSVHFLPQTTIAAPADRLTLLDRFFASQISSTVGIVISDFDPSDGNIGSMLISQAALDSGDPRPPIKVFDADTGWTPFDWDNDEFAYVYAALIANNRSYGTLEIIASPTRPDGAPDGTVWYNTETGVEWLIYEDGDVLLRDNDALVGENLIKPDGEFIFTRNANLQPQSTTNAGSGSGVSGSVGTVFGLRYEPPFLVWNAGSVTQWDIKKGTVDSQRYVSSVNSAPYRYDISDEGDGSYFITAIPSGQNSDVINVNIVAGNGGGITLTDRGRTVAGTAGPANGAQPFIEDGQEIKLTLGVETGNPADVRGTVGFNGSFTLNVSSSFDNYLGQVAQLFATNGGEDEVQLRFTYEL